VGTGVVAITAVGAEVTAEKEVLNKAAHDAPFFFYLPFVGTVRINS